MIHRLHERQHRQPVIPYPDIQLQLQPVQTCNQYTSAQASHPEKGGPVQLYGPENEQFRLHFPAPLSDKDYPSQPAPPGA